MRVRFQSNEGLVFLPRARPAVTIDAGTLGEAEQRALEQLITDARFFELPSRVPGWRGSEEVACHITIEYGGREHSVSVTDPVQGPALRRLVDRLRELGVGPSD